MLIGSNFKFKFQIQLQNHHFCKFFERIENVCLIFAFLDFEEESQNTIDKSIEQPKNRVEQETIYTDQPYDRISESNPTRGRLNLPTPTQAIFAHVPL